MKFNVTWVERSAYSAEVEAESLEEAQEKVNADPANYNPDRGDFIEVEQESIKVLPVLGD